MRRPILVYVLITAVLLAAAGLAYYGYSYSNELTARERAVIIDTMRELAEEKVIGIETQLIETDHAVFDRVEFDNLLKIKEIFETERPAIETVVILDDQLAIMPDGFFTKREPDRVEPFRELLFEQVIPDLHLQETPLGVRGHLHKYYDGRPYLFSHMSRRSRGRTYYIVLEVDLTYLVGTIFEQFFRVQSPRLYKVVDDNGDLVYGMDFARTPSTQVAELGFPETVSRWSLRVAQRKDGDGALEDDNTRRLVDLILIGSALAIIVIGLVILLFGMRRERRANALKSEFISNVSHELKTPLSIISMFGEMLALGRTRSPEQATEYAEIIWKESVRLARLIDNVLDFAKIERGAEAYEFAEGDVVEVVSRAIELSTRRLQGAEIELDLDVDEDLPSLSIDSNALTLAVLNLLDNAIKYAASGKRIEIEVARRPAARPPRVEIVVRDFGPGISEEEQPRIFERFYRARSVRLRPIRGSGIGLALVKHIATAHGGDVTVESRPGDGPDGDGPDTGAVFRLWIPTAPHK